jgi:uncharacterized membrane protein YciS (DUF1049 family)
MSEQNYSNHGKTVPGFVFFVLPVLALNFGWSIYAWKQANFAMGGLVSVLLGAALIRLAVYARTFALRVQDRVIRLEEKIRYERLLPADLKPRIGDFTVNQIVSLRFASDEELPALARKVLQEKLDDRRAIKQLVQSWRPDYLRA